MHGRVALLVSVMALTSACIKARTFGSDRVVLVKGGGGDFSDDNLCLLPPPQTVKTRDITAAVKGAYQGVSAQMRAKVKETVTELYTQSERTAAFQMALSNACLMYSNGAFDIVCEPTDGKCPGGTEKFPRNKNDHCYDGKNSSASYKNYVNNLFRLYFKDSAAQDGILSGGCLSSA